MPLTDAAPTILLVDDDNVLRDVLSRVLTRDGYTVVTASGVAEAMEASKDQTFAAALLDLSLPDGDGIGLADALRARQAELPLILMTAYPIRLRDDPEVGNRFHRVMIKPLNLDELREAVREALRGERVAAPPSPFAPAESVAPAAASGVLPVAAGPRPPGRWAWIKSAATVGVAVIALAVFGVFISGVPIPGLSASGQEQTAQAPPPPDLKLVDDPPHTLFLPDDVKKTLGISKGGVDDVAAAVVPTKGRPLVLTGSTALDPARILRVRARFAPADVVKIGRVSRDQDPAAGTQGEPRELRPGDHVKKGDLLGDFYSDVVGSKKNDLFDAEYQLRLDKEILDRAESSTATTEVFLLNARRNAEGDVNNINRAVNTLRTWGIPEEDIQAIIDEAKATTGARARTSKEKLAEWGRVALKAEQDGVIVEQNATEHELIQDPTTNLFQIAKVDRMLVIANAAEDDLKILLKKQQPGRRLTWTVQTVNAPPEGITGSIEDIGYLIDPNQRSAVVKGYIPNPGGLIRGAQLVTASVPLDPPDDVVEIDVNALIEEGKQSLVFVQTDAAKSLYTLRRVKVTHRFDKTVYVKSKLDEKEDALTPEEKERGFMPPQELHKGDKVLRSGVLELRQELSDREADAGKGS